MIASILILALVTFERLVELPIARRNSRELLAQGGREHASAHYGLIVMVHIAWLAALWWLAPAEPVHLLWLIIFLVVEIGRIWVLASLGRRWTTRIITVPGEQLVRRGPYRWINHPNYCVVVLEIAVLPLVFGLWRTALVFSLLNAAILAVRIHEEDLALGRRTSDQ